MTAAGNSGWARALVLAATVGLAPLAPAAQPTAEAQGAGMAPSELATLLIAHDIHYGDIAWERHAASGRLLLRTNEGPVARTSLGEWAVTDGRRCLRWTRAEAWECYDVTLDGQGGIRFTDDYGNASTGLLVPRDGP